MLMPQRPCKASRLARYHTYVYLFIFEYLTCLIYSINAFHKPTITYVNIRIYITLILRIYIYTRCAISVTICIDLYCTLWVRSQKKYLKKNWYNLPTIYFYIYIPPHRGQLYITYTFILYNSLIQHNIYIIAISITQSLFL